MTSLGDDLKTIIDANWDLSPPTKTCYVYHNSRGTTDILDEPWTDTTNLTSTKVILIIMNYEDVGSISTFGSKLFTGVGNIAVWGTTEANVDSSMGELCQIADNYTAGNLLFTKPTIMDYFGDGKFFVSFPRFQLIRRVSNT